MGQNSVKEKKSADRIFHIKINESEKQKFPLRLELELHVRTWHNGRKLTWQRSQIDPVFNVRVNVHLFLGSSATPWGLGDD